MRRLFLAVALLLVAAFAFAADAPRKYAVLSLMGDRILVVQYVAMIGGRIDRNSRDYLELDDPVLDKVALLAVDRTLKQADSSNKPVLLFGRDRSIYQTSARLVDEGKHSRALLDHVRPLLKGTDATHLILFTKVREEARMKLLNATVGSGQVEGLGFYVDPSMSLRSGDTGETATGFVSAFAYFDATLFDLATGEVVAEKRVLASRPWATANANATDVWSSSTGAQKISYLQGLVRDEVEAITRKLVPAK